MYAVYEYSVRNAVRAAILEIKRLAMPINTVRCELLGLILEAELRSVRESGTESGLGAEMLMHDRDTKFTAGFDGILKSANVRVVKSAPRAPNTNAFVERYIQTLQQEVLDYFIVFGEQHMDHLVAEAVAHYHEERPHQGKENALLMTAPADSEAKQPEPSPDW